MLKKMLSVNLVKEYWVTIHKMGEIVKVRLGKFGPLSSNRQFG